MKNTFKGADAIREFLNPENHCTPLVELPASLNPYAHLRVRIFAKLMSALPLANIKSLPAHMMIQNAIKTQPTEKIDAIIENSSGNTASSLTVIARAHGISRTKAIVSHEVSRGKLDLLRFFGTEIIVNREPICPDPKDKESGIFKAQKLAEQNGWLNPGQYHNKANPKAHETWTGPQIWEQTQGKITIFCAGLGTTGTLSGAGRYLKSKTKNITTVAVVRAPNNPVPGVRTQNLLAEIAFDWKASCDFIQTIGTADSYKTSLELCRNGLLAGPSSGFALAGLLSFLESKKDDLDRLRNEDKEIIAAFICPDSPFPYIEEYFEALPEELFPPIINSELLIKKRAPLPKAGEPDFNIEPEEALWRIYGKTQPKIWLDLENSNPSCAPNTLVIDVRDSGEYEHFHIPCSKNISFQELAENEDTYANEWVGKTVFLVCRFGSKTNLLAKSLRRKKIDAYNIKGGIAQWSEKNLPRWRPSTCKTRHGEITGSYQNN